MDAIRPAVDTLRELQGGAVLDKLAIALKETTEAVKCLTQPGTVTLTITIEPWKKQGAPLTDAPVMFRAEVKSKPPKPEEPADIFFVDESGNPTKEQKPRQRDLGLTIATQGRGNGA